MPATPTLHGIDGCPAGWLVLSQKSHHPGSTISAGIYATLDELAPKLHADDIVAIDMPIGLPTPQSYPRACDIAARKTLGPRACCVFSAPCRGTLEHLDHYPSACAWHREATGKGISCQAFNILPKIHELDQFLSHRPATANFHEIHPEISFAHMNTSSGKPTPVLTKKSSPDGSQTRIALIEQAFPGNLQNPAAMDRLNQSLGPRSHHGKPRWALNDLHDAFAALWSANRINTNTSENYLAEYHSNPPRDDTGKIMLIQA